MTLYKTISDNETTVVLVSTPGGWKTCATVRDKMEANVYIAREERRDVARQLEMALENQRTTAPTYSLNDIHRLCAELRFAIQQEEMAIEDLQGREEAA